MIVVVIAFAIVALFAIPWSADERARRRGTDPIVLTPRRSRR